MIAPAKFSIVVPTYDRPDVLRGCLDSLARIHGPPPEIIVVDDGSPVPAAAAVRWHSARPRVIRTRNRGPAAARNVGARAARGDYIVFVDDDVRPDPSLLRALSRTLMARPNALIGGRMLNAARSLLAEATHSLMEAVYEAQMSNGPRPLRFSTSILAAPREPLLELGGFDEHFRHAGGEDYELCERWQRAGLPALYDPAVVVEHDHPLGFRDFLRQHERYGRGLQRVRRIAREVGASAGGASGAREILRLTLHPLRRALGGRAIVLTGLLVLSQIATAWGALVEELSGRKRGHA
ncbi:MAG: glycosyltransferase [Gemmatimonadetes bacterium]|nr:glycosyltransferase [Gemmatimonadota bacterium]